MGGSCSLELARVFGVGLWMYIRKGYEKFSFHTIFEVEDGSKVSFCHDQWYRDVALKATFPILFGIARAKDDFVAAHLEFLGGSN
jgi:hypothetical protein